MTDTKTCSKCGEVKGLDCFYKRSELRGGGLEKRCAQCITEATRAHREKNLDVVREKERIRAAEQPPEYKREKHKAWSDKNRDYVRKTARATASRAYKKNPEMMRERSAKYHTTHRIKCIEKMKAARDKMAVSYVSTVLRMKTADITPELIAIKREQLAIHRLSRQLKQATKPTGENP